MNCPRCGTEMEGGVCPECGFPELRVVKVSYATGLQVHWGPVLHLDKAFKGYPGAQDCHFAPGRLNVPKFCEFEDQEFLSVLIEAHFRLQIRQ